MGKSIMAKGLLIFHSYSPQPWVAFASFLKQYPFISQTYLFLIEGNSFHNIALASAIKQYP